MPSPSQRLVELGFEHDPFAYLEAEKIPSGEILEETFVAHPNFDRHIMNLSRSAVLLAPRGGGKTAGRLRLEAVLNKQQQSAMDGSPLVESPPSLPLVVNYTNFEKVAGQLPNVTLLGHTGPLLAASAEAVYSFIGTHPGRFVTLGDDRRDWWWAFLSTYLVGEPLEFRISESDLLADWRRTTLRPPPFSSTSGLITMLNIFRERLAALGPNSLFFLVDGIDGYMETQPLPNLEALAAPLLNTSSLLSLPGTVWKFFLPDNLARLVYESAGYKTGRLEVMSIQWDRESLKAFLRLRLEWSSNGDIQDIAQLCSQELLGKIRVEFDGSVDEKLAEMAFRHRRFGPPRALLGLGNALLQVVLSKQKLAITLDDWNKFEALARLDLNIKEVLPMDPFMNSRLQDLADNIRKAFALLKDYEEEMLYESDPRKRARYRRGIEQVREARDRYQREYNELQAYMTGQSAVVLNNVASQLQQLSAKIDALQTDQQSVQEELISLHQMLLANFDADREIMALIIDKLDKDQSAIVQAILEAFESDRISEQEIRQVFELARQTVIELQKQGISLDTQQKQVAEIMSAAKLDVRHGFKFSVPIIPLLLSYETGVVLQSSVDLRATWERLVAKFKGKQ